MNDKQRLMIKIANLYYEEGLTQDVISQRLRLSRPRVSRLMQEAIDKGIVKITIMQEPGSNAEIERLLENKFSLLEVVVSDITDISNSESVARELGMAAAEYFGRIVLDGDVLVLKFGEYSLTQRSSLCRRGVAELCS